KVIDAFPKVARGAGRCSLGALHAVCTAARVIHHAGVTRCGCSISADVRIKSAAPSGVNYELMLRSCNGSRQHFPRLLRARHVDRSADARQLGFDAALLPGRQVSKTEQMRVSASFVLDRDRTARLRSHTPLRG